MPESPCPVRRQESPETNTVDERSSFHRHFPTQRTWLTAATKKKERHQPSWRDLCTASHQKTGLQYTIHSKSSYFITYTLEKVLFLVDKLVISSSPTFLRRMLLPKKLLKPRFPSEPSPSDTSDSWPGRVGRWGGVRGVGTIFLALCGRRLVCSFSCSYTAVC